MKEFKEIIDGIAHSLNMTVDSLVKAYPHLRTEYSWYYACNIFQIVFGVLLLLGAVASAFTLLNWVYSVNDYRSLEAQRTANFKAFAVSLVITIIIFTIFLVASCLKGFTSPDVLIINKVINTISCGE